MGEHAVRVRFGVPVLLAVMATLSTAAPARSATPGGLVQLPGPNDCVSASSTLASASLEGCSVTGAHGLLGADAVALSPDGTSVYVAAGDNYPGPVEDDALARFTRDAATGAVTEVDCVGETLDNCDTKTNGMLAPDDVKVSPDGARAYVASDTSGVTVFDRAADGSLKPAGCFRDPADSSDPSCTAISGFEAGGARGLVVSSDSQFVYAATQNGNAIVEFSRTAGSLNYLGCVSGDSGANATCATHTDVGLLGVTALALSPAGDRLYAVSYSGNSLDVFARDTTTGLLTTELGCASLKTGGGETACSYSTVPGMSTTMGVAVSADGSHVYTTSLAGAVASFSTTTAPPGVAPLGCVGAAPPASATPGCARNDGIGLRGAEQIALAPGAAAGTVAAYVSGFFDDAVAELEIDPSTGELVPLSAPDGCVAGVSSGSSCPGPLAHGLQDADGIAVSPDGNNVYVASRGAGATHPGCGGTCTDTIAALAAFSRFTPMPAPPGPTPPGPALPGPAPPGPTPPGPTPPRPTVTTANFGDQQIALTMPSSLVCTANTQKLAVTLSSTTNAKSNRTKLKFSSAAFYIDKGVRHTHHRTVRTRSGKRKRVVVTTYTANATAHHVPVTVDLSLAGLKSGPHTLKVTLSYKETKHSGGHKKTMTVTKTLTEKFTVC